jgi:putative Mg2+ transporter-C (MgtC) family protein
MISTETIITRLVLSLLLGAVIGLEREYRDKDAGFRTLTLIGLGSCLFTLVSIMLTNGTMDRIASNIVTGIGFLGAGVIFKSDKGVNGLTTAACIWVTAAGGMAIGGGYYLAAFAVCFIVLFVLLIFGKIDLWLDKINRERLYKINVPLSEGITEKYENLFRQCHLWYKQEKRIKTNDSIQLSWTVKGPSKNHNRFIELILKDNTVKEFEF